MYCMVVYCRISANGYYVKYCPGIGEVNCRVYIDGWHKQCNYVMVSKCCVGAHIGSLLLGLGHEQVVQ